MMTGIEPAKRYRRLRTLLVVALTVGTGMAGVAAGLLPYPSVTTAKADEGTISFDNMRDGWDPAETTGTLTPSTLLSGSFGELFATHVDGEVYAQPIIADGMLIVATENDWIYGLNPVTGSIVW